MNANDGRTGTKTGAQTISIRLDGTVRIRTSWPQVRSRRRATRTRELISYRMTHCNGPEVFARSPCLCQSAFRRRISRSEHHLSKRKSCSSEYADQAASRTSLSLPHCFRGRQDTVCAPWRVRHTMACLSILQHLSLPFIQPPCFTSLPWTTSDKLSFQESISCKSWARQLLRFRRRPIRTGGGTRRD